MVRLAGVVDTFPISEAKEIREFASGGRVSRVVDGGRIYPRCCGLLKSTYTGTTEQASLMPGRIVAGDS